MALEKYLIPAARMILAFEEVVKPNFVERSRAGIGGNMSPDSNTGALSAVNHDRRIPPDPAAVALLDVLVAGKLGLHCCRNSVDIVGRCEGREGNAFRRCTLNHAQHDVARTITICVLQHPVQGLKPLTSFFGIAVIEVGRDAITNEGEIAVSRRIGRGISHRRVLLNLWNLAKILGQWPISLSESILRSATLSSRNQSIWVGVTALLAPGVSFWGNLGDVVGESMR